MNINKILLYLENAHPEVTDFAFVLAERLPAKIFALYVIDEMVIKRRVKSEGKDKEKVKEELEDLFWQRLYEIEDLAFARDVKISLLLLEGKVMRVLREVMENYEIGLLVVSRYAQLNIERFLEQNKEKGVIIL